MLLLFIGASSRMHMLSHLFYFVGRGLQEVMLDISDVIVRLWREGTQKQYSVYLWKWDEFCV